MRAACAVDLRAPGVLARTIALLSRRTSGRDSIKHARISLCSRRRSRRGSPRQILNQSGFCAAVLLWALSSPPSAPRRSKLARWAAVRSSVVTLYRIGQGQGYEHGPGLSGLVGYILRPPRRGPKPKRTLPGAVKETAARCPRANRRSFRHACVQDDCRWGV